MDGEEGVREALMALVRSLRDLQRLLAVTNTSRREESTRRTS